MRILTMIIRTGLSFSDQGFLYQSFLLLGKGPLISKFNIACYQAMLNSLFGRLATFS